MSAGFAVKLADDKAVHSCKEGAQGASGYGTVIAVRAYSYRVFIDLIRQSTLGQLPNRSHV